MTLQNCSTAVLQYCSTAGKIQLPGTFIGLAFIGLEKKNAGQRHVNIEELEPEGVGSAPEVIQDLIPSQGGWCKWCRIEG